MLAIGLALTLLASVQGLHHGQMPLNTIRYFNPYQSETYWDGWGSAAYPKGAATIDNKDRALPIETIDGRKCMIVNVDNPNGDPWAVYFKVSGNCLNFLRVGKHPAVRIVFRPLSGDWSDAMVGLEEVKLRLESFAKDAGSGWKEAILPADEFVRKSSKLDLTRIWAISLSGEAKHSVRRKLAVSSIDVLPSATDPTYHDYIKVNQVGYLPEMKKEAFVSYEPDADIADPKDFVVVDSKNRVVFRGRLKQRVDGKEWDSHGDMVFSADFSAIKTQGVYRVRVNELKAESQPFAIKQDAYSRLWRDSLRYFYYSRSAEAIVEPYGEGHVRPGSHLANKKAPMACRRDKANYDYGEQTTKDVAGGWFDAGDTHANVPCTGIACWYLLEAYRDHGGKIGPKMLNLPESNSKQNDLANLAMHGVKWMRKMQNPDGSVCHYIVGADQNKPQSVGDISSQATAVAAGTFAKAANILRGELSVEQENDLVRRAKLAWAWLERHPKYVELTSPDGSDISWWTGGKKGSFLDAQYRAYAAVQLYEATGEPAYRQYFEKAVSENGKDLLDGPVFGWNKTGYGSDDVMEYLGFLEFGFLDYIQTKRPTDPAAVARLKVPFVHQADIALKYLNENAYEALLLYPGHLYWGNNGGVQAPLAIVMLRVSQWTNDQKYRLGAANAIHFILGRNPVNRVFVSGYGAYEHGSDFYSNFWNDLRHQPPGVLGGNINVDGSAKKVVEAPYKRFISTQDADMTEPGVYWNSAFAYLLGFFCQRMPKS